MILCLEGASAVGKTSLAKELNETVGFHVVPEVNELFKRTENEHENWYLERQLERWALAVKFKNSILDGDAFQPIWYHWIYSHDSKEFNSLIEFYRSQIVAGNIRFPDQYIILTLGEYDLTYRKQTDSTRRRSNFERHLQFIAPQKHYFEYIKDLFPDLVEFISAKSSVEEIKSQIHPFLKKKDRFKANDLNLYNSIVHWLQTNKPE